ncbi:hypothetical protein GCM10023116_03960 [Kistimonas scapharcae]|uniref:Uncharacterized protein n=1 Tax=Kistimonas scapharcae TaxID=1036133 RepID=A0ABP8UWZ6_9GAMM
MTANINPETGIAYGYISSNVMDQDVVHALMYEYGADVNYGEARYEFQHDRLTELLTSEEFDELDTEEYDDKLNELDPNWEMSFDDSYNPDELMVEGEYDGVKYASSWMGGCLCFFIFESPIITHKANRASPCVPNAGILDTLDGDVTSYNVPDAWRAEDV